MTSTADLTDLLKPRNPERESPFRQGVLETFNTATGANTVSVGGGVLTDVPILVSGTEADFAVGDIVVLLKMRSSWAILGRVVEPGSSEFASSALGFDADYAEDPTVTLPEDTIGTLLSLTLQVPVFANQALVIATSVISVRNFHATDPIDTLVVTRIGGVQPSVDTDDTVPPTTPGFATASVNTHSYARVFTVTPGGTVTVDCRGAFTTLAATPDVETSATLAASATFRKV